MTSTPTGRSQPGGPKYINDFSKALAGEMKILLAEVGKLRDEKRALQFEIAELMSIKAKHSADGVYAPGWAPPPSTVAAPPEPAPPPGPAPGGWRTVHAPHAPRRRQQLALRAAPAPPPPAPAPAPVPSPNLPAWAQWRPNPLLAPGAPAGPSMAIVHPPPRSGLFGPKTPPPK
ncbi:hypothetical protein B0H17DRAFT_1093681 [Mycena rosella]|uniref:Uncharacterized protein n=1 Tax=Mycena rosella TaxID=1033263 RepID=A0AAD7CU02_MYCRO|nr:hypothetical protein B0H17DRAFT_1093681 [Mycena rosella]